MTEHQPNPPTDNRDGQIVEGSQTSASRNTYKVLMKIMAGQGKRHTLWQDEEGALHDSKLADLYVPNVRSEYKNFSEVEFKGIEDESLTGKVEIFDEGATELNGALAAVNVRRPVDPVGPETFISDDIYVFYADGRVEHKQMGVCAPGKPFEVTHKAWLDDRDIVALQVDLIEKIEPAQY
jgi:hypothetical protein